MKTKSHTAKERIASAFLNFTSPRVFTMPSGEDFAAALARGVLQVVDAQTDPFALHDVLVLAPTRRSVRTLAQAFLVLSGANKAVLLPQILAIGDVDIDEPPFLSGSQVLQMQPAIHPVRRMFALSQLVQARATASGQELHPGGALAEAKAIASLLDSAAHEQVTDFSPVSEGFAKYLEGQPEHVVRAARFLEIIGTSWPQFLKQNGLVDSADRSAKLLDALARTWEETPTPKLVIAAGSTGSQAATARLLQVVSGLPNGCVVLPGLDMQMTKTAWKEVAGSPGHPQYGMFQLLQKWKCPRKSVHVWPQAGASQGDERRRRIISEALTPAQNTSDWVERLSALGKIYQMTPVSLIKDALQGLSLIEAASEEEEALVLGLAIRHALETPEQNVILVTPDRVLARRVRAHLQHWDIEIDDSAGIPLPEHPLGAFLEGVWQWYLEPQHPVKLLSLLRHPLCCVGRSKEQAGKLCAVLDKEFLRGVSRYGSLGELAGWVGQSNHPDKTALASLLADLQAALDDAGWQQARTAASASDNEKDRARERDRQDTPAIWAGRHVKLAEYLAANDHKPGSARLWNGQSGEMASNLLRSLIEQSELGPNGNQHDYWSIYDFFASSVSVRPRQPKGGRARILGPLEARMQSADVVLLGGLNEGTWPTARAMDPFLPASLIRQLGLPDPERKLGLSAHDFAENACKPNVLLSRSLKQDGKPSLASRWLWRLQTLCLAADRKDGLQALVPETDYLGIARKLKHVDARAVHKAGKPFPKPPLELRPCELSVTRVSKLIQNPYAIYGQKILRLRKLDPLAKPAGDAERGTAIHRAMENWKLAEMSSNVPASSQKLRELFLQMLQQEGFTPAQMAVEQIRAGILVMKIAEFEKDLQIKGQQTVLAEKKGKLQFNLKNGKEITITAIVDRIDRSADGFHIYDYKTGTTPNAKHVKEGFDPQLPLSGAILKFGGLGLPGDKEGETKELRHLLLKANSNKIEGPLIVSKTLPAPDLIDLVFEQTKKLFENFDQPDFAYVCQPRISKDRFSDYDHLARRAEWSAVLLGGDDGA